MSRSASMPTSNFDKSEKSSQQKQQIMVPPMKYDLVQGTSNNVMGHLNSLNIITTTAAGPVQDNIKRFKETLRLRHEKKHFTTFGYIPAPPDSDVTRQVIGKDGHFFKMTTTLCEVDFIWHDRVNQMFLFWGSSTFKVVKALNSIRWRIHKIYTNLREQQQAKQAQAKQAQAKQVQQATTTMQYDVEDISDDESDDDDDLPRLISCEEIQLEEQMKTMNISETTECGGDGVVIDEHGFDVNEND